jgi:YD repeat-containing protein
MLNGLTSISWFYDLPNNGGSGWEENELNGAITAGAITAQPVTSDSGVTGNPTPVNGTICSDPVTVSNGNMFQQQTDLAISSRGPAFLLTRTYNSFNAADNGPFGNGWTHSYAVSLKDNGSSVTYVNGSGGVYTFTLQGSTYISPAGLNLALTKGAQGYTITTKHGTQWSFDPNGVLQSITDRNQNTMTLSYNTLGRLTTVTDALNRAVTFSYDAGGHIVSVQDFTGRQVAYTRSPTPTTARATWPRSPMPPAIVPHTPTIRTSSSPTCCRQ